MKTYTTSTTLKRTEKLLQFAANHNCPIITEEGALNDFHIVYNIARIKVNNIRPRNHIICFYKYQNEYSNTLWQTHTDDFNLVKQFANQYNCKDLEEIEEYNYAYW